MSIKQSAPLGITEGQISEAQGMWDSLGWQYTDKVLEMAKQAFPSNTELKSVWLKAALLDRLYNINVYYLESAVKRVVEVFGYASRYSSREIVAELAKIRVESEPRHLVVFASKYVHFYHDDSAPIADWYAAFALTRHFGEPQVRAADWKRDYRAYCSKVDELIRTSSISPTARKLDHYLWLAGNWVWLQKRGAKARINKDLLTFFSNEANAVRANATFKALLR
jgi:hypothetical protein